MTVDIIGATYDKGGRARGAKYGYESLLRAGLKDLFRDLHISYETKDPIHSLLDEEQFDANIKHFNAAFSFACDLKKQVVSSLENKNVPIVVGGDHSIALGSVSGALEKKGSSLGVLWIDAHPDLNTPQVSPSKNLHGMPVAALMGLDSKDCDLWSQLMEDIVPKTKLSPCRMAWMGLRDLDEFETSFIHKNEDVFAKTKSDIEKMGWESCFKEYRKWLEKYNTEHLWISFDIDSMDPSIAPATGTPVEDGFTVEDIRNLACMLNHLLLDSSKQISLCGMDIVEINPTIDASGETEKHTLMFLKELLQNVNRKS